MSEYCKNCGAEATIEAEGRHWCSVFCAEVAATAVTRGVLTFDE